MRVGAIIIMVYIVCKYQGDESLFNTFFYVHVEEKGIKLSCLKAEPSRIMCEVLKDTMENHQEKDATSHIIMMN